MDVKDRIFTSVLLLLSLMFCGMCLLSISIVNADDLPPLLLEYYIPAIYNEVVLPVFPPCPTPIPGEPIVC